MNRTGILLLQTGTPGAADTASVRRYLAEFLSDPMVIDLPRLAWLPLLHAIILPLRARRSARLYQKIWLDNGISPLLHHSLVLARETANLLGSGTITDLAMRYGHPGMEEILNTMRQQGADRFLIFPLFPQYSRTTTGSCVAKLFQLVTQIVHMPPVRIARPFFDHPLYIQALAAQIHHHHPPRPGRHYLFSFHGLPQHYVTRGDPYEEHCRATANLLARAIPLQPQQWTLSFQSRFGPQAWLEPNTQTLLKTLPGQGMTDLAVICPGFVADCLETLEEIAIAGQKTFLDHGGQTFGYVPCLNQSPAWLAALKAIILDELGGWS
ncbi:MAG: ferrochelatase [Magnetococcales bacterium]|nr:ferrochelatase [Magnetococcales bacterium]